jgi:putative flippase GtrA
MTEAAGLTGRSGSAVQLFRFVVVGVASNAAGYLVYLLITYLGVAPKLAMTVLYGVGAALGFVGNRSYTFGHSNQPLTTGVRYVMAHCLGYLLNLSIQIVAVDRLGYPHQLAQAVGICIVAMFLFVAFKYFVFVNRTPKEAGTP